MKKEQGNIVIISMIFIGIAVSIFTFIIIVFMSNINSILYSVKLDMYSINKTAIEAVNNNQANVDNFTYNKNELKKNLKESLKKNYNLNDDLKNADGLISEMKIEEFEIYKKGNKDNFTNEKCDDAVIHSVIRVKVRPIILKNLLEKKFIFTVHEDVNLNMVRY